MIEEAGGSAEAVTCDHTDPDAVRRLVDDLLARHGRIDVLVNNAWGGHDHHEEPDGEEVWDEPMEQFRAMLLAGAYSDFVTDMTVLKHAMGPAGAGIILTTTWHTPEPPAWVPYESSKAAKNRLVYALGHHLREKGIPCIAVAPGWMRTELMEAHHSPGELDGQDRDAALRRAGGGRAGRGSGRDAVHRPHDGRRGAGPGVRLHRPRRHPARPERRAFRLIAGRARRALASRCRDPVTVWGLDAFGRGRPHGSTSENSRLTGCGHDRPRRPPAHHRRPDRRRDRQGRLPAAADHPRRARRDRRRAARPPAPR